MRKLKKFDKPSFENLMSRSVELLRTGDIEQAARLNIEAYTMAPAESFEKGRAARDAAARLDLLGHVDEAEQFATEAFDIHNQKVVNSENDPREAYRERAASALFVGVIGLRRAIRAQQQGELVDDTEFIDYLRSALDDLNIAKTHAQGLNQAVDQYQINATRRVSIAESLFGERKNGIVLGIHAVALALMSESPDLDTTNPNLTLTQRVLVKEKALLGGIAALGVSVLSSPTEPKRHALALSIAHKTI